MKIKAVLFVACLALCSGAEALAQTYPTKPVRLLTGGSPGGSVNILTHIIGQGLSEATGQAFVVDARAGASGNIAIDALLKAPPNGYTILLSAITLASNPSLYSKVPYTIDDLAAICLVGEAPLLIMANLALPANSISELIELAKAKPGMIRSAVLSGGSSQLASDLFRMMADIDMPNVPYKAGVQMFQDVIGGQLEVVVLPIAESLPQVMSKRVKVLAQTGTKRSALAPDIPTLEEAGLKGYALTTWYMLVGSAKMPREVVSSLNREISKALKQPQIQAWFKTNGIDIIGSSPEQATLFLRSEQEKLAKLIRWSGAKVD